MIDTHCHLHDAKAFPEPEAEIAAARDAGVEKVIVVGVKPDDWEAAIAFAERFPEAYALVGWHPNYTAEYDPASLPRLRELLSHPKVLALGEIGLDYHWDFAPREIQHQALREGLDLAVETGMPAVFHAREAYGDLLDILETRPPHPYVFHCFAGTVEEALRATALGAYFGVDGPITYKKADNLREVFRSVPRDRILLETDSPYMAPTPHRGKPNRPSYVPLINVALAQTLEITPEACAAMTTVNAHAAFPKLRAMPVS